MVKTNMFYMAGLSTFGLVYSSTRYIATYLASDKTRIPGVIRNATRITFAFSTLIAIALSLAAPRIETFLETPGIAPVFPHAVGHHRVQGAGKHRKRHSRGPGKILPHCEKQCRFRELSCSPCACR